MSLPDTTVYQDPGRSEDTNPTHDTVVPLTVRGPMVAGGPVIAVDLDDVLSTTNVILSKWHNDNYGVPGQMSIHNFYYHYYWKNPYWGPPETTHRKVREFYRTDWMNEVSPVPGSQQGVESLRRLGYRLAIVTARNKDVEQASWKWVTQHFGDAFERIICTGQFSSAQKAASDGAYKAFASANRGKAITPKLSKAQVCTEIGAGLLIDDSVENVLGCAEYATRSGGIDPPRVLLFGSYEWNQRVSYSSDDCDEMVFADRFEAEGGDGFLERDRLGCEKELADMSSRGVCVHRVPDWNEVVRHAAKQI